MSEIRTSTIVAVCLGTTVTGLAAYAVYFDYKRRNDLDFRRALKREAKKDAKIAKVAAEAAKQKDREQIRGMVDVMVNSNDEEVTWPKNGSLQENKDCFDDQMRLADELSTMPGMEYEAAAAFFKALRVYPQPDDLMGLYDKMLSKKLLNIIAEMEGYYRGRYGKDRSSASSSPLFVEEQD